MIKFYNFHLIQPSARRLVFPLQMIAGTREAARQTILDYTLKGLDWSDRELIDVVSDDELHDHYVANGCKPCADSDCGFCMTMAEQFAELDEAHDYALVN